MELHFLLIILICLQPANLINAAQCSNADYGRFCSLGNSPWIMRVLNDLLFVGTTNFLHVIPLDLQNSESVDLSSDQATVSDCTGPFGFGADDCMDFIRTIAPFPDGSRIMVCGSNAHHPRCTIHQRDQPNNYTKLSAVDEIDEGFSAQSKTHPIVALLANNERFFSATRFESNVRTDIRMSPSPLQGDTSFHVGTPLSDPLWLNQPTFVSVHEYGEHVYFFITEPAFGISTPVKYSRAIRICKTDDGMISNPNDLRITDPTMNHFLTFQKARMECSVAGSGGSIPFFYDDLKSTFLGQSVDGSPVLYGIFNSAINGPAGGAICKFSFNRGETGSLTDVFEGTSYFVRTMSGGQTMLVEEVGAAFSCPGSGGPQRTVTDSMKYQLKFNSITSTPELPLFVSAEFLDKVAAETIRFGNDIQEIIYFTNQKGDIKQVILSSAQKYTHTIYEANNTNQIRDLILHQSNNERSLFASSDNRVMQIQRGRCSNFASCFSCFASRDAYCGWDKDTGSCVNKFVHGNLANLVQSFSASDAEIIDACGTLPTPATVPTLPCSQSPKPPTDPNTIDLTTIKDDVGCSTTKNVIGPSSSGLQANGSNTISIPVIIGATLAAFVFGITIGALICLLFYMRFKSDKKESSSETPKVNASTPNNDLGGSKSKSDRKEPPLETPRQNAPTPKDDESTATQLYKNKLNSEKAEIVKQSPQPAPPRYIQHELNPNHQLSGPVNTNHQPKGVKPAPVAPLNVPPKTVGSPTSLQHASTMAMNRNHQAILEVAEEDSAFMDKDTVPPLPSPGIMYGSLGRHKSVNGVSRKQVPGYRLPRGRTDSTTWLRQRSESLSSDSNTSPLHSPISIV